MVNVSLCIPGGGDSVADPSHTVLTVFDVSQHILQLVYGSLIESVLSFNVIPPYGNVSGKIKQSLLGHARVVNTASKLIGND